MRDTGIGEPGREHRDGGRRGVYRGDERCAIPGIRFEDGEGALGSEAGGEGHTSPITYMGREAGNTWR